MSMSDTMLFIVGVAIGNDKSRKWLMKQAKTLSQEIDKEVNKRLQKKNSNQTPAKEAENNDEKM